MSDRAGREALLMVLLSVSTNMFAQQFPDPDKTPGHATYHPAKTVCAIPSTRDERYVPESVKNDAHARYGLAKCEGYCSGPHGCEVDHLISLELGGANTEDNLWPQPYDGDWIAHDKDRLENKLHELVCKQKTVTLKEAQKAIRENWIEAYKKYIGETRRPFNGVVRCRS